MSTNTIVQSLADGHVLYFDSVNAVLQFNQQCTRLDHKTFQLLRFFIEHQDEVLERQTLIGHVWQNQYASDASLGRIISILRKILAVNGHKFIYTIHKTGYRFVIPPDVQFIAQRPTLMEGGYKHKPSNNSHSTCGSNVVEHPFSEQRLHSGMDKAAQTNQDGQTNHDRFNLDTKNTNDSCAHEPATHTARIYNLQSSIQTNEAADCDRLEKAEESSSVPIGQRFLWVLTTLMFGLSLGMFWMSGGYLRSETISEQPRLAVNIPKAERIAVLSFTHSDEQTGLGVFVEGLNIELLNGLIGIDKLEVIDRYLSLKYSSSTADLSAITEELSVDYVIKGDVRKQGDRIRVGVQLVDTAKGTTLFSRMFESVQSDGFAEQQRISAQVAAAVRLTLSTELSQSTRYLPALSRLDYVTVEQLVLIKQDIDRYQETLLKQSLWRLEQLNQKFPNTPEILGLMAWANAVYVSISAFDVGYDRSIERDLALKALSIDATNLDALLVMYYYSQNYAETQGEAKLKALEIERHHPNAADYYKVALEQVVKEAGTCSELTSVVDAIPNYVYFSAHHAALKYMATSCGSGQPLVVADIEQQDMLDRISLQFGLYRDNDYRILSNLSQSHPNQRFLSLLYCRQLMLGADQMAMTTYKRLDAQTTGYWSYNSNICGYLNHWQTAKLPSDYMSFSRKALSNNTDLNWIAALIWQNNQGEGDISVEKLQNYLRHVPAFNLEVINRDKALGLMMLQHYVGLVDKSRYSAEQLLLHLEQYYELNPQSYRFWSLAKAHFVAAFYAGHFDKAKQVLEQGFAKDEAYWLHDRQVMTQLLDPWQHNALVVDYLSRIEQDELRVKQSFGLY